MSTHIDISYSCSKPELARVKHIYLELSVNFDRKILGGQAILIIEKEPSVTEIILDNYKLNIGSVKDFDTKENLNYHLGDNTNFGSPFTIQLQQIGVVDTRTKYIIQIEYETNPESPALIWLNAEQTADGTHPFMLSNNRMTYARSVFPCQDTPSVKTTYSAKITVVENFIVIMSARLVELLRNDQSKYILTYHFQQTIPISSYAVVIVVGFLRKTNIGSKSCVFAEDKFFQKSIKTFADIDRMLLTAENLCGPYVFDTYDICVLPPSISFLKIQCPNVTFVSPISIGDISISNTIISNMANNWTGNLVTCENYNHLWLHNSFSIFISMKIMDKIFIYKKLPQLAQLTIKTSWNNLHEKIMYRKNISLTKSLIPNLEDMSPNDFTHVPYEMGFVLLCNLEKLLGGPSVFEPFLKSYFSKFAFKSITTNDWLKFLYESFPDKTRLLSSINWNTCFLSTSFIEKYDGKDIAKSTMSEIKYCNMAREWVRWDDNSEYLPLSFLDVITFFDAYKIFFLEYLHTSDMTTTKLKTMSMLYDFQSDIHSDWIRYAWLHLCIKNRWKEIVPVALDFAIECCIPGFVCCLFQDLFKWPETHPLLKESYKTIRTKLLRETQSELESILHL